MSNFEKLTALGADVVGGDLIWKHKVLGRFRDGDLVLTEDGLKALEIDDAPVKEDAPKPAARGVRKSKAVEPAPAPVVEPEALDLGDIEVQ